MNIFGLKITTTSHYNDLVDRNRLHVKATAEATRRAERYATIERSRGILWNACADILEGCQTKSPNATVRRMLKIAEQALIDDPIADVRPEPVFTKGES